MNAKKAVPLGLLWITALTVCMMLIGRGGAEAQESMNPELSLLANRGMFSAGDTLSAVARIRNGPRFGIASLRITTSPAFDDSGTAFVRPVILLLPDADVTIPVVAHTFSGLEQAGPYVLSGTLRTWGRGIVSSSDMSITFVARRDTIAADHAARECECSGSPGDEIELETAVTDAQGNGLPDQEVTFTRLMGDGEFMDEAPPASDGQQGAQATVKTDASGIAAVTYRLGANPLQAVTAVARNLPYDRVVFRMTLGPLAGNGTRPVNIAAGDYYVFTANADTSNISVIDITRQAIAAVVDFSGRADELKGLRTGYGAGSVMGAAVDDRRGRLYVYGTIANADQGGTVVLIACDTATFLPVKPADPDGDGLPGLTLLSLTAADSEKMVSLSPDQIWGGVFANLVTVDAATGRVYAVVPGRVETDANEEPGTIADGKLVVVDAQTDSIGILASVPVGPVPTGVAVNARANRIYVTNRGFIPDDDGNDTVTVIDGARCSVLDTVMVGRSPLGMAIDEARNVVYIADYFGEEGLECCGAVSIIDGESNVLMHTLATDGTTDLKILPDNESELIETSSSLLYVSHEQHGSVFECTAPPSVSCEMRPDLNGLPGKLAMSVGMGLLFGAREFDNSVAVLDLATHVRTAEIRTGVTVGGMDVDNSTGAILVTDFLSDELLAVAPGGAIATASLRGISEAPGQVVADEAHGRIYIVSHNSSGGAGGIPPLMAFDPVTLAAVAVLNPAGWTYGSPQTLALDTLRNLAYITTTSDHLVVLDGSRLDGDTDISRALVEALPLGNLDGTEQAQGVAVDAGRNIVYVARYHLPADDGGLERNALLVVRGPDIEAGTRAVVRPPMIVSSVPHLELAYGRGHGEIALDLRPGQNLIYVTGAYGSIAPDEGFGNVGITVLDGYKLIDELNRVTLRPAAALVGIIPVRVFPGPDGRPVIPLAGDYISTGVALQQSSGLLYVLTRSTAPFSEGFVSVMRADSIINAQRRFMGEAHPSVPGALAAQVTAIPVGIDPEYMAIDRRSNRVVVTNQSLGALTVMQGLAP